MAFSILNNISALAAENQLTLTQTSLQKTLAQLSSGQRINSGSDDAAGLAIANGLKANITALTQSVQNATAGSGMLQTADGALSQVTSLLNRAATLATEAANGTIGSGQFTAMNQEFQNIVTEINSIGSNTYYNGQQVFSGSNLSVYMGDGSHTMSVSAALPTLTSAGLGVGSQPATFNLYASGNPADGTAITINTTGGVNRTYTFKDTPAAAGDIQREATVAATLGHLVAAINGTGVAGVDMYTGTQADADVTASLGTDGHTIAFTATDASKASGAFALTGGGTLGFGSVTGGGSAVDLLSNNHASTALGLINTAVQTIATNRGKIGASINQLTAATAVINTQIQNLSQSEDGIMSADIPTTVANMTKYNLLQQTGMAALSQSNQMQQAVLKLLQ